MSTTTTGPASSPVHSPGVDVRHAVVTTALGELTLVRGSRGLAGLYFPGHWTDPDRSLFGPRTDAEQDDVLAATAGQLDQYLAGTRREFDLPFDLTLDPQGGERALAVWELIAAIPHGRTTTYGALAAEVGGGIGPRAIGGLVARNPISIVIGCHRVVGSTGKLTGYAGGLERKRYLLELEGALPAQPAGATSPLW